MDLIENIKALFAQIEYKTGMIKEVAEDLGKSPNTIRHHWFSESGFWSIPKEYRSRVVELLQKKIALQNEKVRS